MGWLSASSAEERPQAAGSAIRLTRLVLSIQFAAAAEQEFAAAAEQNGSTT